MPPHVSVVRPPGLTRRGTRHGHGMNSAWRRVRSESHERARTAVGLGAASSASTATANDEVEVEAGEGVEWSGRVQPHAAAASGGGAARGTARGRPGSARARWQWRLPATCGDVTPAAANARAISACIAPLCELISFGDERYTASRLRSRVRPRDRSIFATVWTHHPHPAGSIAPLRSRGEPPPRDFAHTTLSFCGGRRGGREEEGDI
jgi:hypothetical protein